jgi:Protein kinase domain
MANPVPSGEAVSLEQQINKLNLKIDKLNVEIDDFKGEIKTLKGKIETACGIFDVLESDSESPELLEKKLSDNPWLRRAMTRKQDTGENRKGLTSFIEKLEEDVEELGQKIEERMLDVEKLEHEIKIKKLEDKIETARGFFAVLNSDSDSGQLLQSKLDEDEFKWLNEAMVPGQDRDKNREGLKSFIQKLEEDVEKLERKIKDVNQMRSGLKLPSKNKMDIKDNPNSGESGVTYDQATHQIGFSSCENFGLVVPQPGKRDWFKVRGDVKVTHFDEIKEAWSLVRDPKALATSDQLVAALPNLDPMFVKNAWTLLTQIEFQLDFIGDMGEMAFQQSFYTFLSTLFMAAAGGSNSGKYRADQTVTSSLSIKCKVKNCNNFGNYKVDLQPDAAATLDNKYDAFAMMEIKQSPQCNIAAYLEDNDKCVLMTAVTAIILRKCIPKESANQIKEFANQIKEIALPFVIATGTACSLYVTTISPDGTPCVKLVGYPSDDGGNTARVDCRKSPSEQRKKIFVALAVLLNKFHKFFDQTKRDKYLDHIRGHGDVTKYLPSCFPSRSEGGSKYDSKRKRTGSGTGNSNNDERSGSNDQENCAEDAAMEAAACGGMFRNMSYPFDRFLHFTDSGVVMDQQKKSPFYFKSHPSSSDILATSKEIFLKVWKLEECHAESVEEEVRYHRKAFGAGVPVAAPVLPEIARSKISDGSEYLVFAVDYIPQDGIDDPWVLMEFCCSLIDTVQNLHHQAGLLHCDLKPDNIRWSNGVVKLIDFGHAQGISEGISTPGTKGYEAPEILNQMPNTVKTDAFSVGRIILSGLKWFEDHWWEQESQERQVCNVLRQVAENLTHADPEFRWSLEMAANELQESSSKLKAIHKGAMHKVRRLNDSSSQPTKTVKHLAKSVLAAH